MNSILCSILLLIWTYDELSRQITVIEKTFQKTLASYQVEYSNSPTMLPLIIASGLQKPRSVIFPRFLSSS